MNMKQMICDLVSLRLIESVILSVKETLTLGKRESFVPQVLKVFYLIVSVHWPLVVTVWNYNHTINILYVLAEVKRVLEYHTVLSTNFTQVQVEVLD